MDEMVDKKMEEVAEKEGIKEMKEALIGVLELGVLLAERFKDGIGIGDFFKIAMELRRNDKFEEAFRGLKQVKAELKDLSFDETVELSFMFTSYVPKFLEALKK